MKPGSLRRRLQYLASAPLPIQQLGLSNLAEDGFNRFAQKVYDEVLPTFRTRLNGERCVQVNGQVYPLHAYAAMLVDAIRDLWVHGLDRRDVKPELMVHSGRIDLTDLYGTVVGLFAALLAEPKRYLRIRPT